MKRFPLLLAFVLSLAVFVAGGAFSDEFLFQAEGFSVREEGGNLILVWGTSGEPKSLSFDAVGTEKLCEVLDQVHAKVEEIEFESFGDESVETRYIASAEEGYRLRVDSFSRFWRSGAFKSFLVLSPVKAEEQPREDFVQEFLVYHHHSESVEKERVMVRMDEGQEVMLEVTPSDEYGKEFLRFREVLGDFTGREK